MGPSAGCRRYLLPGLGLVAGFLPAVAVAGAGVEQLEVPVAHREAAVAITLFYPAGDVETEAVGGTAVFAPVDAAPGAVALEGRHPLVLLSHGGMRSAPGGGDWLAIRLVNEGYAVAVVRGPALGPADAARAPAELWQRPKDMSAVLDVLEEDPRVDAGRVGAVGVFLGGTAVLQLAGARLSVGAVAAACDASGQSMDCGWFDAAGVSLHDVATGPLEGPLQEGRVASVVAIDPEFAAAFDTASFADLSGTAYVLNLGAAEDVPAALDAAELAGAVAYARVGGADRFDAFPECTGRGPAILVEETGDDRLCTGLEEHDRAEIHDRIAEEVARRLGSGMLGADITQ